MRLQVSPNELSAIKPDHINNEGVEAEAEKRGERVENYIEPVGAHS